MTTPADSETRVWVLMQRAEAPLSTRGGEDACFALDVRARPLRIGRGDEADLDLADCTVSRRHAELSIDEAGELVICDAGSQNGTRLNGTMLSTRAVHVVTAGALLQFGSAPALRVLHVVRVSEPPLRDSQELSQARGAA